MVIIISFHSVVYSVTRKRSHVCTFEMSKNVFSTLVFIFIVQVVAHICTVGEFSKNPVISLGHSDAY
jgi:hypothetical protein